MTKLRLLFCFIILILPWPSLAASVAIVEAVQNQVALQRQASQFPLAVGTEIFNDDIITTGAQARAVIRLPDQSVVKIGAQARIHFDRLTTQSGEKTVLSGVLRVLKGVFRFATGDSSAYDVKVQVSDAMAIGIRGTDIFAKAAADKDLVCLIAGKITVQAGDMQVTLTQPRDFFVVPKHQPPLPVTQVTPETFKKWLESTALQP